MTGVQTCALPILREQLGKPGKWWAADLRARETPQARPVAMEIRLEPELASYDGFLDGGLEVAHGK